MIVMKKLFFSLLTFAAIIFPLTGQVDDPDQQESVPIESLILRQKQIPPAIINEIKSDFIFNKPIVGKILPTIQDNYSWAFTRDAKDKKPSFYEAYIRVRNGGNVYVKYNPDGTIIQSEVIRKNAALPYTVAEDLQKSQYKGWRVVGDKELIKYLSPGKNVEEHYRIFVEKNNVRRDITFSYNEPV